MKSLFIFRRTIAHPARSPTSSSTEFPYSFWRSGAQLPICITGTLPGAAGDSDRAGVRADLDERRCQNDGAQHTRGGRERVGLVDGLPGPPGVSEATNKTVNTGEGSNAGQLRGGICHATIIVSCRFGGLFNLTCNASLHFLGTYYR